MVAGLIVLAACGGGGGDPTGEAAAPLAGQEAQPIASGPTPEQRVSTGGSWLGTLGDRVVFGFILQDGRHSLLFSPPGDETMLAGFIQGGGELSATRFTSRTRSYPFGAAALDSQLAAGVDAESMVGTAQEAGGAAEPLLLKYLAYYGAPPMLQSVAGRYNAQSSFGAPGVFTLSEDGQLRGGGDPAQCALSGQLTAAQGNHVFAVSLRFVGPACAFPDQPFTGLAFHHPAALQRLYITVADAQETAGLLFVGDRQ
ncbi:hypothetical protein [Ramlibacter rhizophilus]|nr:hypothetical protein [Ramlibacter rhizophilus]